MAPDGRAGISGISRAGHGSAGRRRLGWLDAQAHQASSGLRGMSSSWSPWPGHSRNTPIAIAHLQWSQAAGD